MTAADRVDSEGSTRELLTADAIGGVEAFRYHVALPTGGALKQWKLAHGGWRCSVGEMGRADDEDAVVSRARRALDTRSGSGAGEPRPSVASAVSLPRARFLSGKRRGVHPRRNPDAVPERSSP